MKALQKNVLSILLVLITISIYAQKNQIHVTLNNCYSGYSATLLLENQIAIDKNAGVMFTAAPLFTVDIKNRWGHSVQISDLSYSFKITNYSNEQAIDFENFDYLNETFITDDFVISANADGYDVEFVSTNYSFGSTYFIDDRASLVVENVLEKSYEFFRNDNVENAQNNLGFIIEISNIQFTKLNGGFSSNCAKNFKKVVLLELENFQKVSSPEAASLHKSKTNNILQCFPNPAGGQVYINLREFEKNQPYYVSLYNTNGQIMLNQKWNPYKAFEINHLNKGIYSIYVLDNFQKIKYTEKLIVK